MIAIGCDHAAVALKETVIKFLTENGYEVKDFGANAGESVDYPDKALLVAECVASGEADKGIIICGTGIGVSIAANKVKGIRCALCSDTFSAHATREHNDANVLCLGGRVIGPAVANQMVDLFIDTEFEGGRHETRVNMIKDLEK